MKKLLAFGFLSMLASSQAYAGFVSIVTGADMAGIEVTATFDNGDSETLVWQVISAGSGGTDTISLESEEGGVLGTMFELTQKGDSLGNVDTKGTADLNDDVFYGLWTLSNLSAAILTSLVIDVLDTGVVFDTLFDDLSANGSGLGRAFTPASAGPTGSYDDLIQDELFGKLTIDVDLASDASTQFFADTDIQVPTPATLSIMLLALGGLVARRLKA